MSLERQLRRARHAYATLSRRPPAETLAQLLLALACMARNGVGLTSTHLKMRAEAQAVVLAPGLCSAATAWQWAKQVQYDAKVALAWRNRPSEACALCVKGIWMGSSTRCARPLLLQLPLQPRPPQLRRSRRKCRRALAMEKRIRGGTSARLGKFVARKGGGWDQSRCTASAVTRYVEESFWLWQCKQQWGQLRWLWQQARV